MYLFFRMRGCVFFCFLFLGMKDFVFFRDERMCVFLLFVF